MEAAELGIEARAKRGTPRSSFDCPKTSRAAAGFKGSTPPAGDQLCDYFEPVAAAAETDGELGLWSAVLLQAIEDYHRKGAGYEVAVNGIKLRGWYYDREMRRDRRRAEGWFKSTNQSVGSFLWICDMLQLDPDRVWARIREKNFALTL
ncbi:MAG: hypothetical protein ACP5IL_12675 [Syntrophobacteraceae bacterium]